MNYYDYMYCKFYKFDTYKVRTADTIRLAASVTLSFLIAINILTLLIGLSLYFHKTLIKDPKFGFLVCIALFTFNFLRFKEAYVSLILKDWQEMNALKKRHINKLLLGYITFSIIMFLVGIVSISIIKTKYGNF